MPVDLNALNAAIERCKPEIDKLDQDIMGTVVGVSQALNELTQALEEVDLCLDRRAFEKAADLGYRSVSTGYVFLQRVLGELNSVEQAKCSFIQDLAHELRCSYEEIAPHVDAVMLSTGPLHPITPRTVAHHSERIKAICERLGPTDAGDGDDLEDEADASPDESSEASGFNFDRAVGFGAVGLNKANAILRAVKYPPDDLLTRGFSASIPEQTCVDLATESVRLGVTEVQLIQAAIDNWMQSNPKKAKRDR